VSDSPTGPTDLAQQLRSAFDRSFAAPAHLDTTLKEDLLAIRSGSQLLALRLSEIGGLFADKKITRIPGRIATLLGIAGFRGAILPVYDLGMLLGQAKGKASRWLVSAAAVPIGLAFEGFDGHLRISKDAIISQEARDRKSYIRDRARIEGVVRPILDLPSVLDAIRAQSAQPAPREER
jgi:chemotaxis signal transduction protein